MPPRTLKEIYDECLILTKASSPTMIQKGKLYKWKGRITSFLVGELQFRCLPNFGLAICDASTHIPCIPVDPVRNINKLLRLYNHTILLSDPEFVVEVFATESNEYYLVNILLNGEKLKVIEKCMQVVTRCLKSVRSYSSSDKRMSSLTEWSYKILALKISSAMLTPKKEIFCFVLVMSMNSEEITDNEKFWLILRNGEVTWRDFLIPNRMYHISISSDIPIDYFRRRSSLYSVFERGWELSFGQMLHHKDLIKVHTFVYLPPNSKIYSTSENAVITPYIEKWLSITDSCLKSLKFASVLGIIKDVNYVEAWKSKNCSWCDKNDSINEDTIEEYDSFDKNSEEKSDIEMEWRSPMSVTGEEYKENENIYLPDIQMNLNLEDKISGFGIKGGKLTVQITLQRNYSSDVSYVFLKRWKHAQYPAGLVPGITVCITDVNIKRSKKKNYYFISTPLTRILHLETARCETRIVPKIWGRYGFPFVRHGTEKVWGTLELDLLTKVSILAKCKLCNEKFEQFCCSNVFCFNNRRQVNPEYTVTAVARLFVRGFNGSESSSLFLKNETVQKFLGLPDRIWQKLCFLCANSELLYLYQDNEVNEGADITNTYFQMYCKYFRPKMRFHVCCRPFKSDENRFFCIELAEISPGRLLATRAAFEDKEK